MTCAHHQGIIQGSFTSLKFLYLLPIPPSTLIPRQPLIVFTVPIVMPFLECQILGIKW